MADISFHKENVIVPGHDPEFLRLWIIYIVENLNKKVGSLCYIFCSDDYILDINRQYLNHDYYTDIITFNYNVDDIVSGDIYVSMDTVKANAIEFAGGNVQEELKRVIIHGVLHLCGYNDKSKEEQKVMTEKENWALKEMKRFT